MGIIFWKAEFPAGIPLGGGFHSNGTIRVLTSVAAGDASTGYKWSVIATNDGSKDAEIQTFVVALPVSEYCKPIIPNI